MPKNSAMLTNPSKIIGFLKMLNTETIPTLVSKPLPNNNNNSNNQETEPPS